MLTAKQLLVLRRPKSDLSLVGVYVLFIGDEPVYVCQTTQGYIRIAAHHTKGIEFDGFAFIPIKPELLLDTEAEYIIQLRPRLNNSLPEGGRYARIRSVMRECGIPTLGFNFAKFAAEHSFRAVYKDFFDRTTTGVRENVDFPSNSVNKTKTQETNETNRRTRNRGSAGYRYRWMVDINI